MGGADKKADGQGVAVRGLRLGLRAHGGLHGRQRGRGPQHPTFSFDLAGNGDLMLTDVGARNEGLKVPASAPAGTWFIIDRRGVVVAELVKADAERLVALPAGTYTVKRRLADRLRVGEVQVVGGQIAVVDEARLHDAKFSDDPVKGAGLRAVYEPHWSVAASGHWQAMFDAPTARGGYFPSTALVGVEATRHNFFGRGFALSMDALFGGTDSQVSTALIDAVSYRYALVTVGAAILYEWGRRTGGCPSAESGWGST